MGNKKILIVDDNTSLHEIYKEFFETKGYAAFSAQNGREGLLKYCSDKPDIVIMDARMPEMDGYESSKHIKSIDPNAKIVMVTGHPYDPLATKSLSEGYVSSVTAKPCNLNTLYTLIDKTVCC